MEIRIHIFLLVAVQCWILETLCTFSPTERKVLLSKHSPAAVGVQLNASGPDARIKMTHEMMQGIMNRIRRQDPSTYTKIMNFFSRNKKTHRLRRAIKGFGKKKKKVKALEEQLDSAAKHHPKSGKELIQMFVQGLSELYPDLSRMLLEELKSTNSSSPLPSILTSPNYFVEHKTTAKPPYVTFAEETRTPSSTTSKQVSQTTTEITSTSNINLRLNKGTLACEAEHGHKLNLLKKHRKDVEEDEKAGDIRTREGVVSSSLNHPASRGENWYLDKIDKADQIRAEDFNIGHSVSLSDHSKDELNEKKTHSRQTDGRISKTLGSRQDGEKMQSSNRNHQTKLHVKHNSRKNLKSKTSQKHVQDEKRKETVSNSSKLNKFSKTSCEVRPQSQKATANRNDILKMNHSQGKKRSMYVLYER